MGAQSPSNKLVVKKKRAVTWMSKSAMGGKVLGFNWPDDWGTQQGVWERVQRRKGKKKKLEWGWGRGGRVERKNLFSAVGCRKQLDSA